MIILADGYWLDDRHEFFDKRISLGDWDGLEDEKDENIFYYLEGAPILGVHGEFVITDYRYEPEEIEL